MKSDQIEALRSLPIGVFDSGVGGLTVLRALRRYLPSEHFIYLGDTARLPYGTKSPDTIQRYSLQATAFLVSRGIKCLVIACNTASATALEVLRQQYGSLPIIGVVDPGAAAGCEASTSGRIAVIATESTVQGGAYQRAIKQIRTDAQVTARACPLFVALAEEGWTSGPIVEAVAHKYLDDLFGAPLAPDTLLLGCTHFPVLRKALRQVVGGAVTIVDSAETTARALTNLMALRNLQCAANTEPRVNFFATDGRERFARVAAHFLGETLPSVAVELVDTSFAR